MCLLLRINWLHTSLCIHHRLSLPRSLPFFQFQTKTSISLLSSIKNEELSLFLEFKKASGDVGFGGLSCTPLSAYVCCYKTRLQHNRCRTKKLRPTKPPPSPLWFNFAINPPITLFVHPAPQNTTPSAAVAALRSWDWSEIWGREETSPFRTQPSSQLITFQYPPHLFLIIFIISWVRINLGCSLFPFLNLPWLQASRSSDLIRTSFLINLHVPYTLHAICCYFHACFWTRSAY